VTRVWAFAYALRFTGAGMTESFIFGGAVAENWILYGEYSWV
jgi:hypothetical protein